MNILYYFQEIETPMFQWQRTHFIDELQHHGCTFECLNPLKYSSPEEANEALLSRIDNHNYDLFFTNVCYEKALFPESVEHIKKLGIPTLSLRCDNLVIPYCDKVLAPYFDLVWLTAIETKYLYDQWGAKTIFAPYAANPFIYSPNNSESNLRKACFIGTPYGSRSIMINQLSSHNLPVDVYYKKEGRPINQEVKSELKSDLVLPSRASILYHRMLFPQGRKVMLGTILNKILGQQRIENNDFMTAYPSVRIKDLCSIYSKYSLALASTSTNHTDILKEPLKIINLRNFEIPMCGGIEICKYNPELAQYFEDGKEIVFYKDNDDLVDKADYFLNRAPDSELYSMKHAARRKAENEHTWWNRFKRIFESLGLRY